MEPVFDTPQWYFQIPPEGTEPSMSIMDIECHSEDQEFRGMASVVAPSDLFKYAKDVMLVEDYRVLNLYMDKEGSRWFLTVADDQTEYDLWYYTKGNLPLWARRVYGE